MESKKDNVAFIDKNETLRNINIWNFKDNRSYNIYHVNHDVMTFDWNPEGDKIVEDFD